MSQEKLNIVKQDYHLDRSFRNDKNGHPSFVLWFTGLSGSGKSTISNLVEEKLSKLNCHTYTLDGDNVRFGLNVDLDFSDQGRKENIRRVSEVSKLMVDAGLIVMTAFISPFLEDRQSAKKVIGSEDFLEIFIDTPIEICEARDVKGLYKKARAGEISNFTGIDSPYETPIKPDIHIYTADKTADECSNEIIATLQKKFNIKKSTL